MSAPVAEMELEFSPIEVPAETPAPAPAEEKKAPRRQRSGSRSRKKAEPESTVTVPNVTKFVHRDRIEELWTDLHLEASSGFYTVNDRGRELEKGVVGYADMEGQKEVRIPLDAIRGLFRVQYVSDMQAEHPLILGSMYLVYWNNGDPFAYVSAEQFEALDAMLSGRVTRQYTYHDLADNKRGYSFDFPSFPSLADQEQYRRQYGAVQRREPEPEPEPDPAQPAEAPSEGAPSAE